MSTWRQGCRHLVAADGWCCGAGCGASRGRGQGGAVRLLLLVRHAEPTRSRHPVPVDNCPLRNLIAYSTHRIARHAPRLRGPLLIHALLVDRGYQASDCTRRTAPARLFFAVVYLEVRLWSLPLVIPHLASTSTPVAPRHRVRPRARPTTQQPSPPPHYLLPLSTTAHGCCCCCCCCVREPTRASSLTFA